MSGICTTFSGRFFTFLPSSGLMNIRQVLRRMIMTILDEVMMDKTLSNVSKII